MADRKYYNFTSPIGRLVYGTPGSYRTTNSMNEPLVYKSGENKGQPKRDYTIGVAYKKDQLDVPAFIRELNEYAAKEWPDYFDADLNCTYRAFASKISDGDSTETNSKGRRNCDREDWRGCWIVWYNSDREPACVSAGADALIDPKNIKTGYFVRVMASCCRNTGEKPGMYMNLEGVELSGFGPEISNRPNARDAFKENKAGAVPEGMSATPVVKGDLPVESRHSEDPPPPPPNPQAEAKEQSTKVLYQGVAYEKEQLVERGWTEAQVAALPRA